MKSHAYDSDAAEVNAFGFDSIEIVVVIPAYNVRWVFIPNSIYGYTDSHNSPALRNQTISLEFSVSIYQNLNQIHENQKKKTMKKSFIQFIFGICLRAVTMLYAYESQPRNRNSYHGCFEAIFVSFLL